VWLGAVWCGLVWFGFVRFALLCSVHLGFGMVCLVSFRLDRFELSACGLVSASIGLVWFGIVWCGLDCFC